MSEDKISKDPRFSKILTDARFKRSRKPEETVQPVEIEPRFEAIFKDERFSAVSRAKVDKKGRRVDKQQRVGDEFREFYQMGKKEEDDDEEDDDDDDEENEDVEEEDDEDDEDDVDVSKKSKRDAARWGKEESSSSSSSEGSDEEEEDDDPLLDELEEARAGGNVPVEYMDDDDAITSRLACVNLNWDLLGAVDILALVKSFCPPAGTVRKVTVYPSNFGKERMALEDVQGPVLDLELEDKTGKPISEEVAKRRRDNALRKYELERRRYFFAIIVCDSAETSSAIYKACDGVDIEETASAFDLRYVPNDQEFDDAEARDSATVVPQNYVPPETMPEDGIASTRVEVSWDVTPASRSRLTMKPLDNEADLDDMDYAHLFASEDSDGGEDSSELRVEDDAGGDDANEVAKVSKAQKEARVKEQVRAKYAALLESIKPAEAEEKDDMIVTFQAGLEEQAEEALKEKEAHDLASVMTPFEKKQAEKAQHKKEKKAARKEKIAAEIREKEDQRKAELKKKKKSKKRDRKDDDEVDDEKNRKRQELELLVLDDKKLANADEVVDIAEDPRFASLLSKPELAIDKTDQRFKPSKSMDKLLGQMREKRPKLHVGAQPKRQEQQQQQQQEQEQQQGPSLDALVKSVKSKAADKLKKTKK